MRVSFIIPALNEERYLPRCLRSIAELDRPAEVEEVEVIVVDNQSTDRTVELAGEAGARVVTVPPGRISRSRNAGARASTGDVLAFIDADCELSTDWLSRCVGHLVADPGVLAVGAGMRPPEPGMPWVETCWYPIAHRRHGPESEPTDWLPTYNILVRRTAFEAVGGFDESLITCEDSDLGYRLSGRGKLLYDNVARFVHHGESKTLRQFFRREAWRSQGSLRSMTQRRQLVWSELPSLVVPPAFALAWIIGLALVVGGLIAGSGLEALVWVGAALLLIATLLPVVGLLKKRISPAQPSLFVRGWVLISVYLWARAIGLVLPLARVKR